MSAATTPGERWRLGYRPALDGVRGIAIGLVLVSHLLLGGNVGGLAGVTLFFVLSGYLITALLVGEHSQTGRIDLRAFYGRRLRRLLPALVLVVVAVTAVQLVMGAPNAVWAGLGALSYMANWLIVAEASLQPIDHTWSLAVEEHFYLLWPALLIMLIGRRWLVPGLLLLAALSVAVRVWLVMDGASLERIAYGTDARADALLIGCALGLATDRVPVARPRYSIPVLLVASAVATYTPLGLTAGLLAVALAGALVIRHAAAASSWLAWAPLARLGRLSYGVYLYHLPLWYATGGIAQPWRALLVIGATLLLAETSYRWVEQPILVRGRRRPAPDPEPALAT